MKEKLELCKLWILKFDKYCDLLSNKIWEKSGFAYLGPFVCFLILVFMGREVLKSQSPYAAAICMASIIILLKLRKAYLYTNRKTSLIGKCKKCIFNYVISIPPVNKWKSGIVELNEKLSTAKRSISGLTLIISMLSLLITIISGVIGLNSFNDVLRDYLLSPLEFGGLLFIYLLFEESINIDLSMYNGTLNVSTDGNTLKADAEINGISGSIDSKEDKTELKFSDDKEKIVVAEIANDVKVGVDHCSEQNPKI